MDRVVFCTICGNVTNNKNHSHERTKEIMLNSYSKEVAKYRESKGFVTDWSNMLEKLCLVHSEVSEVAEAYRDNDRVGFNEEIADTFIRLMDICGTLDIDIESEIKEKMKKNRNRPYYHGKTMGDIKKVENII